MATAHIRNAKVAAGGLAGQPFETMQYYKVSFTEVTDLVSRRMVYVNKGFAFVPESDLISILVSRFRVRLSQKLAIAFRSLPYVRSDERLRPILKMLETAYVGPEYGADASGCGNRDVRAETLDSFANNMPLCMREIHSAMKREHHIKYHARLQSQLFLKGIGLSMADCLRFFQQEFAKKPTPPDVFQKKYAYSIRHTYGQEGKRANYRSYDCVKIVMGVQPANSSEHHGCPFKTFNPSNLRRIFTKQAGATNKHIIDEIMEKVEQKQYGLACRRHFELSHPGGDAGPVGNHPNAWFDESVAYFEKTVAAVDGAPKAIAGNASNPSGESRAIASDQSAIPAPALS
jgi:DNA primase large subunit